MKLLNLGNNVETKLQFTYPIQLATRHISITGTTGSGKTFATIALAEEFALNGIPCVIFENQGDITSLTTREDDIVLASHKIPLDIKHSFEKNVDVVIWSAGSDKANLLSINPLEFDNIKKMSVDDREAFVAARVQNIIDLISETRSNETKIRCMITILTNIIDHCINKEIKLNSLNDLIKILNNYPANIKAKLTAKRIFNAKLLDELIKKIALLTEGPQRLMFSGGTNASVEELMGYKSTKDRTRVSVIYLNTLSSEAEKNFFVNSICQMFYEYMLLNPPANPEELRGAIFFDEAGHYVPPVRKTSCKKTIITLFKQARKYGFSMVISSQNPSDIDYKVYAQINTFLIGKINTAQDIKYLKMRIKSSGVGDIDETVQLLSRLRNGKFLTISTELSPPMSTVQFRWPISKVKIYSPQDLISLPKLKDALVSSYPDKTVFDFDTDIVVPSKLPEFKAPEFRTSAEGTHKSIKSIELKEEKIIFEKNEKTLNQEVSKFCKNNINNPISQNEPVKMIEDTMISANHHFPKIKHKIVHNQLSSIARKYLKGVLWTNNKIITAESYLKYFPLIKTTIMLTNKARLIFHNEINRKLTIYLDFIDFDILNINRNGICFEKLPKLDIALLNSIDSSFEMCEISQNKKLNYSISKEMKNNITSNLKSKYNADIIALIPILLPVWSCQVLKNDQKTENLFLDGVHGLNLDYKGGKDVTTRLVNV